MSEKTEKLKDNRFKPGKSGNPKGRPKGARNKATLAVQTLLAGEAEELTLKAIDMAKTGDQMALRPEKNSQKEIAKITDNTLAKNPGGIKIKVKAENKRLQLYANDTTVKKITGFSLCAGDIILSSNLNAAGRTLSAEEMEARAKQIFSAMVDLQTRDGFEGMIISQMLTVYDKAMECFSLSTTEKNAYSDRPGWRKALQTLP